MSRSRAAYRKAHLAYAQAAVESEELILSGAAGEPVDCAMLLFNCNAEDVPQSFAENDPYIMN